MELFNFILVGFPFILLVAALSRFTLFSLGYLFLFFIYCYVRPIDKRLGQRDWKIMRPFWYCTFFYTICVFLCQLIFHIVLLSKSFHITKGMEIFGLFEYKNVGDVFQYFGIDFVMACISTLCVIRFSPRKKLRSSSFKRLHRPSGLYTMAWFTGILLLFSGLAYPSFINLPYFLLFVILFSLKLLRSELMNHSILQHLLPMFPSASENSTHYWDLGTTSQGDQDLSADNLFHIHAPRTDGDSGDHMSDIDQVVTRHRQSVWSHRASGSMSNSLMPSQSSVSIMKGLPKDTVELDTSYPSTTSQRRFINFSNTPGDLSPSELKERVKLALDLPIYQNTPKVIQMIAHLLMAYCIAHITLTYVNHLPIGLSKHIPSVLGIYNIFDMQFNLPSVIAVFSSISTLMLYVLITEYIAHYGDLHMIWRLYRDASNSHVNRLIQAFHHSVKIEVSVPVVVGITPHKANLSGDSHLFTMSHSNIADVPLPQSESFVERKPRAPRSQVPVYPQAYVNTSRFASHHLSPNEPQSIFQTKTRTRRKGLRDHILDAGDFLRVELLIASLQVARSCCHIALLVCSLLRPSILSLGYMLMFVITCCLSDSLLKKCVPFVVFYSLLITSIQYFFSIPALVDQSQSYIAPMGLIRLSPSFFNLLNSIAPALIFGVVYMWCILTPGDVAILHIRNKRKMETMKNNKVVRVFQLMKSVALYLCDKFTLGLLFLLALYTVNVFHAVFLLFFITFLSMRRLAKMLWPLLVIYTGIILCVLYSYGVIQPWVNGTYNLRTAPSINDNVHNNNMHTLDYNAGYNANNNDFAATNAADYTEGYLFTNVEENINNVVNKRVSKSSSSFVESLRLVMAPYTSLIFPIDVDYSNPHTVAHSTSELFMPIQTMSEIHSYQLADLGKDIVDSPDSTTFPYPFLDPSPYLDVNTDMLLTERASATNTSSILATIGFFVPNSHADWWTSFALYYCCFILVSFQWMVFRNNVTARMGDIISRASPAWKLIRDNIILIIAYLGVLACALPYPASAFKIGTSLFVVASLLVHTFVNDTKQTLKKIWVVAVVFFAIVFILEYLYQFRVIREWIHKVYPLTTFTPEDMGFELAKDAAFGLISSISGPIFSFILAVFYLRTLYSKSSVTPIQVQNYYEMMNKHKLMPGCEDLSDRQREEDEWLAKNALIGEMLQDIRHRKGSVVPLNDGSGMYVSAEMSQYESDYVEVNSYPSPVPNDDTQSTNPQAPVSPYNHNNSHHYPLSAPPPLPSHEDSDEIPGSSSPTMSAGDNNTHSRRTSLNSPGDLNLSMDEFPSSTPYVALASPNPSISISTNDHTSLLSPSQKNKSKHNNDTLSTPLMDATDPNVNVMDQTPAQPSRRSVPRNHATLPANFSRHLNINPHTEHHITPPPTSNPNITELVVDNSIEVVNNKGEVLHGAKALNAVFNEEHMPNKNDTAFWWLVVLPKLILDICARVGVLAHKHVYKIVFIFAWFLATEIEEPNLINWGLVFLILLFLFLGKGRHGWGVMAVYTTSMFLCRYAYQIGQFDRVTYAVQLEYIGIRYWGFETNAIRKIWAEALLIVLCCLQRVSYLNWRPVPLTPEEIELRKREEREMKLRMESERVYRLERAIVRKKLEREQDRLAMETLMNIHENPHVKADLIETAVSRRMNDARQQKKRNSVTSPNVLNPTAAGRSVPANPYINSYAAARAAYDANIEGSDEDLNRPTRKRANATNSSVRINSSINIRDIEFDDDQTDSDSDNVDNDTKAPLLDSESKTSNLPIDSLTLHTPPADSTQIPPLSSPSSSFHEDKDDMEDEVAVKLPWAKLAFKVTWDLFKRLIFFLFSSFPYLGMEITFFLLLATAIYRANVMSIFDVIVFIGTYVFLGKRNIALIWNWLIFFFSVRILFEYFIVIGPSPWWTLPWTDINFLYQRWLVLGYYNVHHLHLEFFTVFMACFQRKYWVLEKRQGNYMKPTATEVDIVEEHKAKKKNRQEVEQNSHTVDITGNLAGNNLEDSMSPTPRNFNRVPRKDVKLDDEESDAEYEYYDTMPPLNHMKVVAGTDVAQKHPIFDKRFDRLEGHDLVTITGEFVNLSEVEASQFNRTYANGLTLGDLKANITRENSDCTDTGSETSTANSHANLLPISKSISPSSDLTPSTSQYSFDIPPASSNTSHSEYYSVSTSAVINDVGKQKKEKLRSRKQNSADSKMSLWDEDQELNSTVDSVWPILRFIFMLLIDKIIYIVVFVISTWRSDMIRIGYFILSMYILFNKDLYIGHIGGTIRCWNYLQRFNVVMIALMMIYQCPFMTDFLDNYFHTSSGIVKWSTVIGIARFNVNGSYVASYSAEGALHAIIIFLLIEIQRAIFNSTPYIDVVHFWMRVYAQSVLKGRVSAQMRQDNRNKHIEQARKNAKDIDDEFEEILASVDQIDNFINKKTDVLDLPSITNKPESDIDNNMDDDEVPDSPQIAATPVSTPVFRQRVHSKFVPPLANPSNSNFRVDRLTSSPSLGPHTPRMTRLSSRSLTNIPPLNIPASSTPPTRHTDYEFFADEVLWADPKPHDWENQLITEQMNKQRLAEIEETQMLILDEELAEFEEEMMIRREEIAKLEAEMNQLNDDDKYELESHSLAQRQLMERIQKRQEEEQEKKRDRKCKTRMLRWLLVLKKFILKGIDPVLLHTYGQYQDNIVELPSKRKATEKPLLHLLYLLFASYSQLLIIFVYIINAMLNPSFLTLVILGTLLLFGMLQSPRASHAFIVFLFIYTAGLSCAQFLFQMPIFCVTYLDREYSLQPDSRCGDISFSEAEWQRDHLFGIYKIGSNSRFFGLIAWQFIALLLIVWHRSVLMSKGVWFKDEEHLGDNILEKSSQFREKEALLQLRQYKHQRFFKYQKKALKNGIDPALIVSDDSDPLCSKHCVINTIPTEIKTMYYQVIPRSGKAIHAVKPGSDLYFPSFILELLASIWIVLAYSNMATTTAENVGSALNNNFFQGDMVIALLIQVIFIVFDRVVYLKRSLALKVLLQYVTLIYYGWRMCFQWPVGAMKGFVSNPALQFFFVLKAAYFILSALQIQFGFPPQDTPNTQALTTDVSIPRYLAFRIYRAIPFVFELRVMLDWYCSKTALDLWDTFKLEDIYAKLYISERLIAVRNDKERGKSVPWYLKLIHGLLIFIGLLILLFIPLLLFSSANPDSKTNNIYGLDIHAQLVTDIGAFSLIGITSITSLKTASPDIFTYMRKQSWVDTNDKSDSVQVVQPSMFSDAYWTISPESKDKLISSLDRLASNNDRSVFIDIAFSFKRNEPAEKQITTTFVKTWLTVDNIKELLGMIDPASTNPTTSTTIKQAIPPFIRLPSTTDPVILSDQSTFADLMLTLKSVDTTNTDYDETTKWWALAQIDGQNQVAQPITITTVSSLVWGTTILASFNFSVIAIYTVVVFTIGQFVRTAFGGSAERIIVDELMGVSRLMRFCQGIYIARAHGLLLREEELYRKLVRIYRSPEKLVQLTARIDEKPDTNSSKDKDDSNETKKTK